MFFSYDNIKIFADGATSRQILAVSSLFLDNGECQGRSAFFRRRVSEQRRRGGVRLDGALQPGFHFRHGDDVALEIEAQPARVAGDQVVRALDEILARAHGAEDIVIARRQVIVDDGA